MKDIVLAIEKIKKLEYQYLYDKYPYYDPNFYKIISKILLTDMKNLNIFQGNGLQFIFILIEKSIYSDDLKYEKYSRDNDIDRSLELASGLTINENNVSIHYAKKRIDSDAKEFFINKVIEFDDWQTGDFIYDIVSIKNHEGNIEKISEGINNILASEVADYYKTYSLMKLFKQQLINYHCYD